MWLLIDGNPEVPRYKVFESFTDCKREAERRGYAGEPLVPGGGPYCAEGVDLVVVRVALVRCSTCAHGTPLENALVPCDHGNR